MSIFRFGLLNVYVFKGSAYGQCRWELEKDGINVLSPFARAWPGGFQEFRTPSPSPSPFTSQSFIVSIFRTISLRYLSLTR